MPTYSKSKPIGFLPFLQSIKNGNDNILQLLNVDESELFEASYETILDNPGMMANGINRFQVVADRVFFILFNNLAIQHSFDGEVKYTFTCITREPRKIISLHKKIWQVTQHMDFDRDRTRCYSFLDEEELKEMAKSEPGEFEKDFIQFYNMKGYTFGLHYHNNPPCLLDFIIIKKNEVPLDYSVRNQGSILDLLTLNVAKLLTTLEIKKTTKSLGLASKYADYSFKLDTPEMGIFDQVTIRIYNGERQIIPLIRTDLFLYSSQEESLLNIDKAVDKIIRMYGSDNKGRKDLELYEWETIEQKSPWIGRKWDLNTSHALVKVGEPAFVYQLAIGLEEERGLYLTVTNFNELVKRFGAKNQEK